MIEIVKIGYEELTVDILYSALFNNFNLISTLSKEKVKAKIKDDLVYYYLKDSLLKEPFNPHEIIFRNEYEKNKQYYKVVKIPQKDLEGILLKNKLGGYLTFNIMQEKEFDKKFDELYFIQDK